MTIRLIDARRGLYRKCKELFGDEKIAEQIYRYLCDGIEECENAERVGKWITKPNIYGAAYCSECDFELRTNDTNYCPNCGARMEGEEE